MTGFCLAAGSRDTNIENIFGEISVQKYEFSPSVRGNAGADKICVYIGTIFFKITLTDVEPKLVSNSSLFLPTVSRGWRVKNDLEHQSSDPFLASSNNESVFPGYFRVRSSQYTMHPTFT